MPLAALNFNFSRFCNATSSKLKFKSVQIFDNESKLAIKKELGDVLWYVSNLCTELNFSLEDVALQNLEKLKLRSAKGMISGSGDDR